jgi:two-component system OmpR family sensor kinase
MLDRLQGAFARERRFTSDASHELRAPLSVIRAEADVALRKERETSEYRRALSVIVEEADALEHLTRELLAAARADAPTGTGATAVLAEVVHSVGARMHKVAQERQITICVTEHTQGEAFVSADRATLERAIVPIVHNAIMHARAVVELRVERDGDFEALRVSDDGAGFSESGLERAFERFWRDDDARRRAGTGLGMPIARALILASGGTIEIANRPGGGASVHICLPRAASSKSHSVV